MKRSLIFILLIYPGYCFSAGDSKGNTCDSKTFYADMKGDGVKEMIVLVNEKLDAKDRKCHFKSLTIYEKNKKVYEETIKREDEQDVYSRVIEIERVREDDKEMIFYDQHYCSNCNSLVVLGFMKGKYQTILFDGATGGEIIDLEGDGNKEIVVDPHGYYGSMPKIYDYNPIKDEFIASEKKHLKFYRDLIQECEVQLDQNIEEGVECCTRTVNLGMIASAAIMLGDNELYKKTTGRLSAVYVDIGKYYYSKNKFGDAIKNYKVAIEKNNKNFEAFNYLGYSYFKNREFKKAVDSLENSIAINPSYVEGHYNLALAYWAALEKERAIDEINAALKLDPKYKEKIKNDTQFNVFKRNKEFKALIMH